MTSELCLIQIVSSNLRCQDIAVFQMFRLRTVITGSGITPTIEKSVARDKVVRLFERALGRYQCIKAVNLQQNFDADKVRFEACQILSFSGDRPRDLVFLHGDECAPPSVILCQLSWRIILPLHISMHTVAVFPCSRMRPIEPSRVVALTCSSERRTIID